MSSWKAYSARRSRISGFVTMTLLWAGTTTGGVRPGPCSIPTPIIGIKPSCVKRHRWRVHAWGYARPLAVQARGRPAASRRPPIGGNDVIGEAVSTEPGIPGRGRHLFPGRAERHADDRAGAQPQPRSQSIRARLPAPVLPASSVGRPAGTLRSTRCRPLSRHRRCRPPLQRVRAPSSVRSWRSRRSTWASLRRRSRSPPRAALGSSFANTGRVVHNLTVDALGSDHRFSRRHQRSGRQPIRPRGRTSSTAPSRGTSRRAWSASSSWDEERAGRSDRPVR